MDNKNYVNLKLDAVFKSFFSNKNNEDLLKDFLASILDIPLGDISDVDIDNTEVPIETINDKFSRLDLNLKIAGKNVNVEMQVKNEEGYKERAVYYLSKLYCSLKRGEDYTEIPQTIAVHILNHQLFDCADYQSTFRYYEANRHELLTDQCAIHFFELPKLSGKLDKSNRKELWLNLISADSNERYDEIAETGDETMKSAVNVIYDMREDTRIREAARMREKSLNDMYSSLNLAEKRGRREGIDIGMARGRAEGIDIGMAKGRAEGREEGREEGIDIGIAKDRVDMEQSMLANGISPELVAQIMQSLPN